MGKGDVLKLAIQALETEDLESLSPEDLGEDLIWFEDISRSFEAERPDVWENLTNGRDMCSSVTLRPFRF